MRENLVFLCSILLIGMAGATAVYKVDLYVSAQEARCAAVGGTLVTAIAGRACVRNSAIIPL